LILFERNLVKNPIVLLSAKVLSVVLALSILGYFVVREQTSTNPAQSAYVPPNSLAINELANQEIVKKKRVHLPSSKALFLSDGDEFDYYSVKDDGLEVLITDPAVIKKLEASEKTQSFTVVRKKLVYLSTSKSKRLSSPADDRFAWYLKSGQGPEVMITNESTVGQLDGMLKQFPSRNPSFEVLKAKPIFVVSSKSAVIESLENPKVFWQFKAGELHRQSINDEELINLLDKLSAPEPETK
jgi:hypothetical protein